MNDLAYEGLREKAAKVELGRAPPTRCHECRFRKNVLQRAVVNSAPDAVPSIVHEVLRSPGQSLDRETRAFMEPRFGHDFSRVRVHTDSKASESERAVNALAYTVGHDVVFGQGQFAPATISGKHLIAHELTHVAQKGNNEHSPEMLRIGRANSQLEADADRHSASLGAGFIGAPMIETGQKGSLLQRAGAAPIVAAAAGGFLLGFGAAFAADYLSMTRARAERYARDLDKLYPGWLSSLPNCPCTIPDGVGDRANWVRDSNPDLGTYHPGAAHSFRSTSGATGGSRHGQQCTYDSAGRLINSRSCCRHARCIFAKLGIS